MRTVPHHRSKDRIMTIQPKGINTMTMPQLTADRVALAESRLWDAIDNVRHLGFDASDSDYSNISDKVAGLASLLDEVSASLGWCEHSGDDGYAQWLADHAEAAVPTP
jgi:hypothetical protein